MASEELEKIAEDDLVYRNVGNLMLSVDKEDAQEDLEERIETLELRVKVTKRQETKITNRMKEMESKIKSMAGESEGIAPAG